MTRLVKLKVQYYISLIININISYTGFSCDFDVFFFVVDSSLLTTLKSPLHKSEENSMFKPFVYSPLLKRWDLAVF